MRPDAEMPNSPYCNARQPVWECETACLAGRNGPCRNALAHSQLRRAGAEVTLIYKQGRGRQVIIKVKTGAHSKYFRKFAATIRMTFEYYERFGTE